MCSDFGGGGVVLVSELFGVCIIVVCNDGGVMSV